MKTPDPNSTPDPDPTFSASSSVFEKAQELQAAFDAQEEPKLDCGLTRTEVNQLKAAKLSKPGWIPIEDWSGPRKLSHIHEYICHLAALGHRIKEISETVRMNPQHVSTVLKTKDAIELVRTIRQVEFQGAGITAGIDRLAAKAIRTYDEILDDPVARQSTKAKIAQDVLDRKQGRPNQQVEIKGSYLKDFIEELRKYDSDQDERKTVSVKSREIPTEAEIIEPKPESDSRQKPEASNTDPSDPDPPSSSTSLETPGTRALDDPQKWLKENFE